jgi:molybdopterin synthase sulfur carrier subunit
MKLTLRYFASVRELIGTGQETIETKAETLDALRQELVNRGGHYVQALGFDQVLRMALNQKVCDGSAPLNDGAEVAFFPPVTGG